jgi:hypothetical protein
LVVEMKTVSARTESSRGREAAAEENDSRPPPSRFHTPHRALATEQRNHKRAAAGQEEGAECALAPALAPRPKTEHEQIDAVTLFGLPHVEAIELVVRAGRTAVVTTAEHVCHPVLDLEGVPRTPGRHVADLLLGRPHHDGGALLFRRDACAGGEGECGAASAWIDGFAPRSAC